MRPRQAIWALLLSAATQSCALEPVLPKPLRMVNATSGSLFDQVEYFPASVFVPRFESAVLTHLRAFVEHAPTTIRIAQLRLLPINASATGPVLLAEVLKVGDRSRARLRFEDWHKDVLIAGSGDPRLIRSGSVDYWLHALEIEPATRAASFRFDSTVVPSVEEGRGLLNEVAALADAE